MNKELIKKYKKEFDHWLNGGNIQVYYKTDDEPKWWVDEENIESCNNDNFSHMIKYSLDTSDVLVVIDDEYVEFRKALAEGKIVQEQDYYTKEWVDMKNDNFHGASDTQYEGVYRIKPEELKFQVGDWVRDLRDNRIFQINSENFNLNLSITNGVYVHWQPKPGEWCWFHNGISSSLVFAMFYNSNSFGYWIDEDECDIITNSKFHAYKYCEPFIGNLPTIILN